MSPRKRSSHSEVRGDGPFPVSPRKMVRHGDGGPSGGGQFPVSPRKCTWHVAMESVCQLSWWEGYPLWCALPTSIG